MGDLGKLFKKSQVLNIGNPQAMHWGLGHYDRKDTTPFDALSKASRQNMTAKQKREYLAREKAKGVGGPALTPLTDRYS